MAGTLPQAQSTRARHKRRAVSFADSVVVHDGSSVIEDEENPDSDAITVLTAATGATASMISTVPFGRGRKHGRKKGRGRFLRPMTNKPARNIARPDVADTNVFGYMHNINANLSYCHSIIKYSFRSAFGNLPTEQELPKYEFMLRLVDLLRAQDEVLESAMKLEVEVVVKVSALDEILFPIIWTLNQACGTAEQRVEERGNRQTLQIELREEHVEIGHIVAVFAKEAWVVEDGEGGRLCLLENFATAEKLPIGQPDGSLTVRYCEGLTTIKRLSSHEGKGTS